MLLSTTIVESGLDIPSANTLIVHRADRFGLAQLYQLRGRVGRAKIRAYAYFTTPADRLITETADKRLQVLAGLDSLGAGFQLATHDLDIRGAGNLLGDEQSGHIKEVGFELYQSMLEEAILEAKAGGARSAAPSTSRRRSRVDAPILIPEDYVPDLDLRMGLYRRMNELESADGDRPLRRRDDRPLRHAARGDREPAQDHRDQDERRARRWSPSSTSAPKGALVHFHNDSFPDLPGLLAYVERLKGTAQAAARQQAGHHPRLARRRARGSTARCSCRRAWRRSSPEAIECPSHGPRLDGGGRGAWSLSTESD